MVTPRSHAEIVLPQGTTTICWDPHEIGNVAGLDGVRWAVDASRDLPLRVLVLAPCSVPSAPGLERAGAAFGPHEMRTMLAWPEIAGVAGVMDMRGVIECRPRMRGIVGAGLASGKLVGGHARDLGRPRPGSPTGACRRWCSAPAPAPAWPAIPARTSPTSASPTAAPARCCQQHHRLYAGAVSRDGMIVALVEQCHPVHGASRMRSK